MALRFYAEISNIRRELFKVEIHDSSFSGSSTEFTLRGNGFDLSYNGGKETYQLIKSSTLTFVMNITDATLRALPIDIATSDSVKGETISYMVFGFMRNRAASLTIESLKGVFRAAGGRRRTGR